MWLISLARGGVDAVGIDDRELGQGVQQFVTTCPSTRRPGALRSAAGRPFSLARCRALLSSMSQIASQRSLTTASSWLNPPGESGDSGLSRLSRSRDCLDSHATVMMRLRSNSIGLSQPSWLWRRLRLCQISRYSKIALASSSRVFHVFRSSVDDG